MQNVPFCATYDIYMHYFLHVDSVGYLQSGDRVFILNMVEYIPVDKNTHMFKIMTGRDEKGRFNKYNKVCSKLDEYFLELCKKYDYKTTFKVINEEIPAIIAMCKKYWPNEEY
jgi:hypothetical protein